MKRLAVVAAVLAFGIIPIHTHAQRAKGDTGADLYSECQSGIKILTATQSTPLSNEDYDKANFCFAYLLGMKDMLATWNAMNESYKHREQSIMCVPVRSDILELSQVVVKYVDDHPTELRQKQAIVVVSAFRKAYPCSKNAK